MQFRDFKIQDATALVKYPGRVHSAHAQGVLSVAPSRVENVIWKFDVV